MSPRRKTPLISRRLKLKRFMSNLEFWFYVPSWLHEGILPWSNQNLLYFERGAARLPDLQRSSRWSWRRNVFPSSSWKIFPTFTCLFKVTSLVFKYISRLRKQEVDCDKRTAVYLMKTLERYKFSKELGFLLDRIGRTLPRLFLFSTFSWA